MSICLTSHINQLRLTDVCSCYAGFNVTHRRRKTGQVGFQHRLGKEDAMKWFQQKYDGVILNTKAK